ncbi:hypothetical protein E5198_08800 [Pseudomonas sp. A-1]|uniref:hypothetical protein n=1 Tax=Pseudomonas sp. A-1 TaxID=1821274 RepID=UPI0010A693AF|nr:hypothetical protein [Pseudomonas sp. A-1]THG82834.1 hypothetical protein E5198_08800 [Pseudomonas sp. A-1]
MRYSAAQSGADQVQAEVLPLQDEGVGCVHGGNPSAGCALMASIAGKLVVFATSFLITIFYAGFSGFRSLALRDGFSA